MDFRDKQVVFCLDCGACLGIYRQYYASEHLKKFPLHHSFLTMTIIDPLLSENPDEWFKRNIPLMKNSQHPKLNTEKKNDQHPKDEQI